MKDKEQLEERAERNKERYSRKTKEYCYERWRRISGSKREYELFWLNMHYLYGLMQIAGRK